MNIGDKVRIKQESQYKEIVGVISESYPTSGGLAWRVKYFDGTSCVYYESCLELIINKTSMNIKEKFALAFKSEPEKTFRKAGITNGDDFLTEDGQKIFLSWLMKKYGADFKKEVVDDLVKEDEKDCGK